MADELDTSVSILLGGSIQETCQDESDLKCISEKLEVVNLQLARINARRLKTMRCLLASFCIIILMVFNAFAAMHSSYLNWDFNDPELAVAGTLLHGLEFLFVRLAPFVFFAAVTGIVFTYKKQG